VRTGHPAAGRREYLITLALGAVGAAVVLLSVRQGWGQVQTIQPRPLPPSIVSVRGQDLVPAAGALGLAALAGLAAVIATRRMARRLVGGLLAAFGVAIAASVTMPLTDAQVRSAASGGGASRAGAGAIGSTIGGGSASGSGGTGIAGVSVASHVVMAAFPWRWAVLLGALVVIAAGVLVAWRSAAWPVMSSRYDQPAGRQPAPADPATLWESLSQGIDPTDTGADPAGHPGGRDAGAPGTRGLG
jgi:uncharacterized membrane protein (TIGR02234 family)